MARTRMSKISKAGRKAVKVVGAAAKAGRKSLAAEVKTVAKSAGRLAGTVLTIGKRELAKDLDTLATAAGRKLATNKRKAKGLVARARKKVGL